MVYSNISVYGPVTCLFFHFWSTKWCFCGMRNMTHSWVNQTQLFVKSAENRPNTGSLLTRNGEWIQWTHFRVTLTRINGVKETLKGKFPQTTMWIGWVESNFRNPTVKFGANLDNSFKRTNYAKFCISPSLDGTMPESVISQENNSPLTLYIEFHNCYFCLDINSQVDQVQF